MSFKRSVCVVDGCYNISGTPNVFFSVIPREKQRLQKWIQCIGENVKLSRTSMVCSEHFASEDIKDYGYLKRTAIPTIPASGSVRKHGNSKSVSINGPSIEKSPPVTVMDNADSNVHSAEPPIENSAPVTVMDNADSIIHNADGGCVQDETDENMSECSVINNIKHELCRVCGKRDDSLISIFENTSLENTYNVPLVKLLEMYLPLKIQGEDKLPSKICSKCSCMLDQWHELYVTCVAADKAFRNMFSQGKSEGDGEASVPRSSKEVVQFSIRNVSSKDDLGFDMKEKTEDQLSASKCGSDDKSDSSKDKTYYNTVTIEEKIEYPEKQGSYNPQYARKRKRKCDYVCKYCYDMFNEQKDLRAHSVSCKESHTLCDECGRILPRKGLMRHKFDYHSTKKLCDKCGKSFYSRYLYYHMMLKHSGTFSCELCGKVIKSKVAYRHHLIRHKTGEIKTTFKANPVCKGDKIVFVCPVCNLNFDDKLSLIMHLNTPKLVKCPVCKVKLSNEIKLHCHSCKKWSCLYCSRGFYKRENYLAHERIHTGEKPYKCSICDMSFRSLTLRLAHWRTAHNDPTHECPLCSKKYYVASQLRRHMDAHESVGYLCPLCDKQLRTPDTLQRHIKLHKMGKI